jgi:hypothetical protein
MARTGQSTLIFMIIKAIIVIVVYLIFLRPFVDSISNDLIRLILNIIIFIFGAAFVIGGILGMFKF